MEQHIQTAKYVADGAAASITAASLLGWMPQIAALFTAVYMVLRIWETKTARRLLKAVCASCAAWWEE